MARKAEAGIEYFPINADIIHNPKIRLMVAEFGSKTTWAVLLPLYCKIYREKGYWLDWLDEDSKLLFAQDECKLELSVVNEFVNGCVRRSLFDKGVFDLFGILTSDRIQENFIIAKSRSKNVVLISDFLLLDECVYINNKNVALIPINATLIHKKVTLMPQKEKEKKIIEGEGDNVPPTHTEEQLVSFKNFEAFIVKDAVNVSKMKEPFKIDEFFKLKENFSSNQIKDLILKMHNYKPLLQKNNSAYLTFLNWSKKDYQQLDQKQQPSGPTSAELKANKILNLQD